MRFGRAVDSLQASGGEGDRPVTARASIVIAPLTSADVDSVHGLIHRSIDACYTRVYPPRAVDFFKAYHSAEAIGRRASHGVVLVAWRGDRIVGTGSLVDGEISGVFVDPAEQGLGIGALLMDALEDRACAGGAKSATLSVSLPSRGFYERRGYRVSDPLTTDVGEGQHLEYREAEKDLTGTAEGSPAHRDVSKERE